MEKGGCCGASASPVDSKHQQQCFQGTAIGVVVQLIYLTTYVSQGIVVFAGIAAE
jgi:hypothetical protein